MRRFDVRLSVDASVEHPQKVENPVRVADLKSRQAHKITAIRESLIFSGHDTFGKQVLVLGLSRSTAWHLLNGHYKGSGLSAGIVKRILSSSTLPSPTREVIQEYVQEKLGGIYGHNRARLKAFRKRMDAHPCHAFPLITDLRQTGGNLSATLGPAY
jgi:hypothetical protein